MDQYTKEGPSVQERITYGRTSEDRRAGEAKLQAELKELDSRLSDNNPIVPVQDKMTEELRKL